jgi:glutamate N-acetyltransferase/amino-acid N-acetyltransferase
LAGKVDENQFQKALDKVCIFLAKLMAKDGEGAKAAITVNVTGAKTESNAKKAAKSIINSNLVKCAVFGHDPNWGRIIGALGCAGIGINPQKVDISFENMKIAKNGIAVKFDAKKATKLLKKKEVVININLKQGKSSATAYGCDLTFDYVKINAEYHT